MISLSGFQARPVTLNDVNTVVKLWNASSRDTCGGDRTAVHWQMRHWLESGIDLAQDALLVSELSGRAVGYSELTCEHPYLLYEMAAVVHPLYRGNGIGSFLLQWAARRVEEQLERAPPSARVMLHQSLLDCNQPGRSVLLHNGFDEVRRMDHLRLDMNAPPPEPEWPEDIRVSVVESEDWKQVVTALEDAFQDHWYMVDSHGETIPPELDEGNESNGESKDPTIFDPDYFNSPGLCFAAWDGSEVVGSCLCNAKTVEFPGAGYLGSLSVRRPWRRRGIAMALVRHAFAAFYQRGIHTVLTDTDAESFTGANFLYRKAGMRQFRQEIVYEKEIRPGKEWLKRRSDR